MDAWWAVGFADRLDRPVGIAVGERSFVVFRDGTGRAAALDDRCPHRGAALSQGTVVDGCVRCPYHGWRFSGDGRCVAIPANPPDAPIPLRARVDAHPTHESAGLVWLWVGDRAPLSPPLPEAPPLFRAPADWRAVDGAFDWRAHVSRIVENSLDISHTAFVHAGSFGDPAHPEVEPLQIEPFPGGALATVTMTPPAPRGLWRLLTPRKRVVRASTGFAEANVTWLRIDLGRMSFVVTGVHLPLGPRSTRTLWRQQRSFFRGAWADRDARRRMQQIFREDAPVVESQEPPEVPRDSRAELSVRSDSLALAWRRQELRILQVNSQQ
jgi:phenylpropionate dioxygenase-like ring-hydroxylating dioxygenase large terminal subunit